MTQAVMTFRDYMEKALYHPEYGYYSRITNHEPRTTDFYTAPMLHPAFARALAHAMVQLSESFSWDKLTLVEAGSGQGQLAYDILWALWQDFPKLFESVLYIAVERSPARRAQAKKQLERFSGKVQFLEHMENLPLIDGGIIFSNELIDAFAVHVVVQTEHGLQELGVSFQEGSYRQTLCPLSSPLLQKAVDQMCVPLALGQRMEVNLQALEWLKTTASKIKEGFLVTLDYGGTSSEILRSAEGTLRAFQGRRVMADVLSQPGQRDITSSVNFTQLMEEGKKCGWEVVQYTTQANFLLSSGLLDWMPMGQDIQSWKERSAMKMLFHPDGMGERFKVLVQKKTMNEEHLRSLC